MGVAAPRKEEGRSSGLRNGPPSYVSVKGFEPRHGIINNGGEGNGAHFVTLSALIARISIIIIYCKFYRNGNAIESKVSLLSLKIG